MSSPTNSDNTNLSSRPSAPGYATSDFRLTVLTDILRHSLDEGTPLDQDAYSQLRDLLKSKHHSVTPEIRGKAQAENHRLNLAKVRYEDLVEAFQGDYQEMTLDLLRELQKLSRVFDDGNVEMKERVDRIVELMVDGEKRKGMIGPAGGLGKASKVKNDFDKYDEEEKTEGSDLSWI